MGSFTKSDGFHRNQFLYRQLDEAMGLVKSITIKPPYGTGVDVFDRQKMRVKARLALEPSVMFNLMLRRIDQTLQSIVYYSQAVVLWCARCG
jgi:hypothetical protein